MERHPTDTRVHHNFSPSTQKSLVSFDPNNNDNAPLATIRMPNGVHFRFAGGS
jgi:hypothetical protein